MNSSIRNIDKDELYATIKRDSKVLLVDDMEFNILALENILKTSGFLDIEKAKDGKEALEKTKEINPDLVILDIVMPEIDGYGYCEQIRKEEEFANLPILVQSGVSDADEKRRIFEVGATDYVSKPIDPEELIARTLSHLEKNRLFNDLELSRKRMSAELEQAKAMQNMLMPSDDIISQVQASYNIEMYSLFETSSELGGDFWGVEPIDEQSFAVYCTDFSGHGVASALNTFRLHTIMQEDNDLKSQPDKYLDYLNEKLYHLLPTEQFATMFYGVIDVKEDKLRYVTAGSTKPIVMHKDNGYAIIPGDGFPLSIQKGIPYDLHEVDFYKNDLLLLYSDALIETPSYQGDLLTEKDLVKMVKKMQVHRNLYPENLFNTLVQTVKDNFWDNITDDLTINLYFRT